MISSLIERVCGPCGVETRPVPQQIISQGQPRDVGNQCLMVNVTRIKLTNDVCEALATVLAALKTKEALYGA